MSTETLTIADFLLARIAEDEAEARRWLASREPWRGEAIVVFFAGSEERVLAECEAKRRIVYYIQANEQSAPIAGDKPMIGAPATLEYLAAVYADHPDYRDEWRP